MREYLKGLHFYDIRIRKSMIESSYNYRVCTYRSMDEIEKAFVEQKTKGHIYRFEPAEIDHDMIIDEENYFFPMFCVELSKVYGNIDELIEDILVGRLSGILDVDVNHIMEENNG